MLGIRNGMLKAKLVSREEELKQFNNYFKISGYPIGMTVKGLKIVRDTHCNKCVFYRKEPLVCTKDISVWGPCNSSLRRDNRSVSFRKP
jgi:hypothetical protein